MDQNRPYVVLARLDIDRHSKWWIKQRGSDFYEEWEAMSSSLAKRRVRAERLTVARKDFHVYVGDPQAIAEIHRLKDELERIKS